MAKLPGAVEGARIVGERFVRSQPKLLVLAVLALVVFGPRELPKFAEAT